MAEVVADLFQRQALRQQVGSTRMSQHMSAIMRQYKAQGVQSTFDDYRQTIAAQGPKRGQYSKKHLLPIRPGPHLPQVAKDRIAHRTAQWIGPRPLRFAMGNAQYLSFPIKVLQTQSRDFPSAESIHGKQHQHGAIADVSRPAFFGSCKQTLHVIPRRTYRQTFMPEDPWSHDRGCQPVATPATSFCESKKSTQGRRPSLNGDACIPFIVNFLGQQFIHLGHGQLLESEIRLLNLREKLVSRPTVVRDGFRRQSTFLRQIVGKFGDVIGVPRLDGDG